ncbi:hypothetical protein BV25DRAFT_1804481, partial [Artomyces pyxidatus]
MSSQRHWFHQYQPLDVPRKVWLGDNRHILAHGTGRVPVLMQARGRWNKVILQDVLYVPDLHGNLLSVSALARRGAVVQFLGKTCEILDKDGILTCEGHLEDSLYIVHARTEVPE